MYKNENFYSGMYKFYDKVVIKVIYFEVNIQYSTALRHYFFIFFFLGGGGMRSKTKGN